MMQKEPHHIDKALLGDFNVFPFTYYCKFFQPFRHRTCTLSITLNPRGMKGGSFFLYTIRI